MSRYRRTKRVLPHPRRNRRATPLAPGRIGREEIGFKLRTGETLWVEVTTTTPEFERQAEMGGWVSKDMGLYRHGERRLISVRCSIGGAALEGETGRLRAGLRPRHRRRTKRQITASAAGSGMNRDQGRQNRQNLNQ